LPVWMFGRSADRFFKIELTFEKQQQLSST